MSVHLHRRTGNVRLYVEDFCRHHQMSRAMYYKLLKKAKGRKPFV